MQVKNYKEPFYHSIIEDFYSDVELSDILAEIKDLKEHSLGPSETGDPRANTLMTAVQLDRHYINRRNDSKILTHNRKMFYLEEELKDNPFARYLPYTNDDVTQLNYYKDGAEYKHHADHGSSCKWCGGIDHYSDDHRWAAHFSKYQVTGNNLKLAGFRKDGGGDSSNNMGESSKGNSKGNGKKGSPAQQDR